MNTRTWTAILLVMVCTALYGCAQETSAAGTATPTAEISTPIPAPTATTEPYAPISTADAHSSFVAAAPPPYYGLRTLAEAVLDSDIIARVELLSLATSTVSVLHGDQTTHWLPLVDFTFTVHEYLKGTGGPTIIGSITGKSQDTQELAVAETAHLISHHDSQWNDRQAIVFLRTYPLLGARYWLGYGDEYWPGDTPGYQVTSRHERSWLPQANTGGASGGRDKSVTTPAPSFMLEAPSATSGSRRASARGGGSSSAAGATISLSALKTRIAELETEANAGGTDEYRECIEAYYHRGTFLAAWIEQGMFGGVFTVGPVMSGQPEGIVLSEHWSYAGALNDDSESSVGRHWFEGDDPGVVKYRAERFWLDEDDKVRVMNQMVTSRPLPAGDYQFFRNGLPPWALVCGKHSPLEINKHSFLLSVTTSSVHTVHEAFFDPVDIGSAVGADGSNGVLEPNAFSLDGATTIISSLKWEDSAVSMTLNPTASLADYAVDFIDVTGTTTLSLTSDNASTTALAWTVPDKPWSDGDLLMLRIHKPISNDATLSALALSGVDLAFDPATTTYTASVPATTTQTTVTPTTNHASATYVVKLADVVDADGTITLAAGDNLITIDVTAEDAVTTKTYSVTVTRATPSSPITVTLIPRVDGLTFFDIDIQWSHSGTCDNYYVAIITDADYQISFLGFHPPETSSHYVEGSWLYNNVPDFWVVVECRTSGQTQEVGRASLRAAHPDNN